MEAIARLIQEEGRADSPELPSAVDAYLIQVRDEQHRHLEALATAARDLTGAPGQVANVAALHLRLSQQLFDAQRLILKRRADAHAAVVRITTDAEHEVDSILRDAHEQTATQPSVEHSTDVPPLTPRSLRPHHRDDLGLWSASDGRARAIDRAFDRETDELMMARQLRELLDEWWRVENQEDQAAIDDASARAAMRVHLARVEAGEIGTLGVRRADAAATSQPSRIPISMPVPITVDSPATSPLALTVLSPPAHPLTGTIAPAPAPSRISPEPMLAALDAVGHEDLESVLASLFDTLENQCDSGAATPTYILAPDVLTPPPIIELASLHEADSEMTDVDVAAANELRIRCDIADVEQIDRVRQEAFDRFWEAFRTARQKPISRDWIAVQVMLPAVGVIAVIALVMAWVG